MNTRRVAMRMGPRRRHAWSERAAEGQPCSPQSGILLIECLIYLACLFAVLGAALAVFYQTLDFSRDLRRNADDIARVLKAGERWRTDVRSATGRIVFEEGPGGRALRIPREGGATTYFFVTNAVLRCAAATGRCETILPAVQECRFVSEPRQRVTAWRWDLELPSRLEAVRVHPLFTFTAVARPEEAQP
ncbi:MAG TPA: hypothetical protein PK640_00100 [Verrucomicrobiota bacterium]|nr:hypothetical protein [Verrucomicrobiota bacterium]